MLLLPKCRQSFENVEVLAEMKHLLATETFCFRISSHTSVIACKCYVYGTSPFCPCSHLLLSFLRSRCEELYPQDLRYALPCLAFLSCTYPAVLKFARLVLMWFGSPCSSTFYFIYFFQIIHNSHNYSTFENLASRDFVVNSSN